MVVAVGINLAMLALIDRALLSAPPHIAEPRCWLQWSRAVRLVTTDKRV